MNYNNKHQKKHKIIHKSLNNHQLHKKIKFSLILIIILIALGSLYSWGYGKFYINTNNAYLNIENVSINSLINGKIKFIHIENEQYVNVGDLLVNFDDQEFIDKLNEAETGLLIAKEKLKLAEFRKSQAINSKQEKIISNQEYNSIINNYNLAKNEYERSYNLLLQIESDLKNSQIISNFDGWITNIAVKPGDLVTDNEKLFTLVKDQTFWININLSKKHLKDLKSGQKVQVKIKAFPDYKFEGTIIEDQYYNPNSQQNILKNPIKILIHNKFHLPLRNGMEAEVKIMIAKLGKYYKFFNQN